MTNSSPDDRGTFAEMIAYFRVSERAARNWVKSGQIGSFRIGHRCWHTCAQVVAFQLRLQRFNGSPFERQALENETAESWREHLRRTRSAPGSASAAVSDSDPLRDLVRRVERLERLLGSKEEVAA